MSVLRGTATALLPGSCGFGVLYLHGLQDIQHYTVSTNSLPGGTGICIAAFVNEPRCKQVYDWITKNCKILYQSPRKRNRNSGRDNFLVVFKRK